MADNVAITAGSGTTVATNEDTINSTAVQVQRVTVEAGTTYAAGQVTVTNTHTTIAAARDTRKSIIVINYQTVPVIVGPSAVTTTTGIRLNPGDAVTITTKALIDGITAAAYSAVGDAQIHYLETYDS
jgi:predicted YcjX-like family ATPase